MHWTNVNMVLLREDGTWQAITTEDSSTGIQGTAALVLVDTDDNRALALRLTNVEGKVFIFNDDALVEFKLC